MSAISRLARRRKLRVIEDCAQSLGALYRGAPTSTSATSRASAFIRRKTSARSATPELPRRTTRRSQRRCAKSANTVGATATSAPGSASTRGWTRPGRDPRHQAAASRSRQRETAGDREALRRGLARLPLHLPAARRVQPRLSPIRDPHRRTRRAARTPERERIGTGIHYPAPVHLQPAYAGGSPISPPVCPKRRRHPGHPEPADVPAARLRSRGTNRRCDTEILRRAAARRLPIAKGLNRCAAGVWFGTGGGVLPHVRLDFSRARETGSWKTAGSNLVKIATLRAPGRRLGQDRVMPEMAGHR